MSRATFTENDLRIMRENIARKNKAQLQRSSSNQKPSIIYNTDAGIRIPIAPLSVNKGYTGKRYKTDAHRQWHKAVQALLPKFVLPAPPFELYLKFGFATDASDWDNGIKFFADSLAKKYGFNDKLIRRAVIETDVVGVNNEYIEWNLKTLVI